MRPFWVGDKKTIRGTTSAFLFILLLKCSMVAGFNFVRPPQSCVTIPNDLTLCHNVGYRKMVIPNLLNHESLDEARQQAHSFVPLLREHCHPHLQIFLCSLFAPVCLPAESAVSGPIWPCRSLCKSVERHCLPIMQHNGFDWPAMLNCSKFTDQEPCVKPDVTPTADSLPTTPETDSNICAPCGRELQADTLHDNFCASEFVLKIKVKRMKTRASKGTRDITADKRRRVIYKNGPLSKQDLKRLKLVVKGSKKCDCPQLDNPPDEGKKKKSKKKKKKKKKKKNFYLVMGRKVGRKLYVNIIHLWGKKNKILKKAAKKTFGADGCPSFGNPEMGGRV
ncbi:secreted frizzled-related protein 1-like isoform X2 [Clavelina lepadiformis]|uniref:Secreted frizzled-related protein 1 n=1 Tax=Clavelina lepadiformis TaxID=159417 RepID=A0ABP0F170_CLALP